MGEDGRQRDCLLLGQTDKLAFLLSGSRRRQHTSEESTTPAEAHIPNFSSPAGAERNAHVIAEVYIKHLRSTAH